MSKQLIVMGALWAACAEPSLELPDQPDVLVEDPGTLGDLSLTVEVVGVDALNPAGDGSGIIQVRAQAAEAASYAFRLDGSDPVESTTGEAQLVAWDEGTRSYTLSVTASTANGERNTVSERVEVYRSDAAFPRLVWSDEFDVEGRPDPEKWVHQTRPPLAGGWFNGEQQHYTDRAANSFVSGETLKIVARAERYETEGSVRPYTSARLNSTFAFTYGRVEARAKLPVEGGTWPAIWTLGANINELGNPFGTEYGDVGWPDCGEIDILEQRGWDKQNTIAYFHWGNTRTGAYESEGSDLSVPTSTSAWHVYALEWTPESLQIFVDDDLVHELANTEDRPYDNPHYILLNVAMGGNLGGEIPEGFTEATLEIDYVRVYQ